MPFFFFRFHPNLARPSPPSLAPKKPAESDQAADAMAPTQTAAAPTPIAASTPKAAPELNHSVNSLFNKAFTQMNRRLSEPDEVADVVAPTQTAEPEFVLPGGTPDAYVSSLPPSSPHRPFCLFSIFLSCFFVTARSYFTTTRRFDASLIIVILFSFFMFLR